MSSAHPPWLRFQAFTVGLPKTGSTSIAALFARFRCGHEFDMAKVAPTALARAGGSIDDATFLESTGTRLTEPRFEMDSATFHHLYADILVGLHPQALFIQPVRDARSWVNSFLDMAYRKAIARHMLREPWDPWERDVVNRMLGGVPLLEMYAEGEDDTAAVPPLLEFWAAHMQRVATSIPAERLLRIPVQNLSDSVEIIADFVGVDSHSLRASRAHANRAPVSFDRFRGEAQVAFRDSECAFIEEEFGCLPRSAGQASVDQQHDWKEYSGLVSAWARSAVAADGRGAAR
jgi:hypothetical protein